MLQIRVLLAVVRVPGDSKKTTYLQLFRAAKRMAKHHARIQRDEDDDNDKVFPPLSLC